jgi:hypothetical protein
LSPFITKSLARRIAPLLASFALLVGGGAHAQTLPTLSETLLDVGGPAQTQMVSTQVTADAVADLNHDGIDDIVAVVDTTDFNVERTTGSMVVFLGKPDGTFSPAVTYPTPGYAGGLAIVDMNQDGNGDIVFGSQQAVAIMYGDGTGGFAPMTFFPYPPDYFISPTCLLPALPRAGAGRRLQSRSPTAGSRSSSSGPRPRATRCRRRPSSNWSKRPRGSSS